MMETQEIKQDNELMKYDEFERDWKRKHRTSIPRFKRVSSASEFFWIMFWVLVAIGAAVFSAAHTIPAAEMTIFKDVPNRSQLAVSVFVIVELVIFGAAAQRHEIKWLVYLLIGAILVALVGNISSSVRAVNENGGDILNQIGGVLLAIIAPVTALAAGEVLHIQLSKRSNKMDIARTAHEQANKEMEGKINQAYTRYQKELEGKEMIRENSRNFTKPDEPIDVHESSRTVIKPRVKIHEIARTIHENGDSTLSVTEMMDKYGISQGSTSKVRDILKQQNGHSTNGAKDIQS